MPLLGKGTAGGAPCSLEMGARATGGCGIGPLLELWNEAWRDRSLSSCPLLFRWCPSPTLMKPEGQGAGLASGRESRHRRVGHGSERTESKQSLACPSPGHLGGRNDVSLHLVSCILLPEMSQGQIHFSSFTKLTVS